MFLKRLCPVLAVALMLSLIPLPASAAKLLGPKCTTQRWTTPQDFVAGTFDGTVGSLHGDGAVTLGSAGDVLTGDDPDGLYGVTQYSYGMYTTPELAVAGGFDWAVASWNAVTPCGTWVQVEARAKNGGAWTKWYNLGIWAEGTDTIARHSVSGQKDKQGTVNIDTLVLRKAATAVQLRATLFTTDLSRLPIVDLLAITTAMEKMDNVVLAPDSGAWGTTLPVPQRSQMDYLPAGSGWCSPTSTSMVLEYWANVLIRPELNQPVPTVAGLCYDNNYGGTGNWPFNTACAGAYGLEAYVRRFESLSQVEQWIKQGVPVIISISFSSGELTGAPISSTGGHLIVIVGFGANGDVVCNDPAASRAEGELVRVTYNRSELEQVWLGTGGVAYLIYPVGRAVPAD